MDKRKMKKLLILNLPYFLVGLFATNLGEAWRLAEGADSSAKILSFFHRHTIAALYAFSQSVDRISSQQHRKGHVLPDAGRYALQRAGGRERNPLCLLPCHSHCRSPVPQLHDGQAFSE